MTVEARDGEAMAANHRQVANASVGMRPSLLSYVGRAFEIIGGIVIILGVVLTPALFILASWRVPNPAGPFLAVGMGVPAGFFLTCVGGRILKHRPLPLAAD